MTSKTPDLSAAKDAANAPPGAASARKEPVKKGTDRLAARDMPGPLVAGGVRREQIRRFLVVVAIVALLESALVMGLNVTVDPRNEFHTGLYEPLIPDYPAQKLALFGAWEQPPATVVMGSSKAQSIDPDDLEALGFGPSFNFALPGTTSRDHLLLYRHLLETGRQPDTLILGLDANMFWNAWGSELEQSSVAGTFDLPEPPVQRKAWMLLKSLSPFYVWDAIQVLEYTYLSGYPQRAQEVLEDGQIASPRDDADIAAGTFNRTAHVLAYIESNIRPLLGTGGELAPGKQAAFRTLVNEATAAGTRVVVYLTTNHPLVLQALENDEDFRFQLDTTRQVALEMCPTGMELFDFLAIDAYDGYPDGFYDGWHIDAENGRRQMAAIAGQPEANLCLTA